MNPRHRPLSRSQKAIVFAALFAVALTTLYPPWVRTISLTNRPAFDTPAGYAFLWEPPIYGSYGVYPDWGRLVLQWLLIAASASAVVLVLPVRKSDPVGTVLYRGPERRVVESGAGYTGPERRQPAHVRRV